MYPFLWILSKEEDVKYISKDKAANLSIASEKEKVGWLNVVLSELLCATILVNYS